MDNDNLKVPRCHYCERIAPTYQYKSIAVCSNCMNAWGQWIVFRDTLGGIFCACENTPNIEGDMLYKGDVDSAIQFFQDVMGLDVDNN